MLKLSKHHKFHIPNGLAVAAAVLLLLSSVVNVNTDSDIQADGTDSAPSAQIESAENNKINDSAEHKRRGINLGHLLFRRG